MSRYLFPMFSDQHFTDAAYAIARVADRIDDGAAALTVDQAAHELSQPHLNWLPPDPEVPGFRVRLSPVSASLLYDDPDYFHLFVNAESGRFVEADAFQIETDEGDRVSVIYADYEMALLFEFWEERGRCSAQIEVVVAPPEALDHKVQAWKRRVRAVPVAAPSAVCA